ncbi:MAG: pyridoxal-phosphate dependent enzyme [Deltaproteobacteria bacterium]|nr:pyridoxal-phosphate dependent enzyme [Deltaproteobacteria bacterium]MBW2072141.1 pyridoxal-phosphate dependent enzyme [Deltaproteobacteria bacterium]
MNRRPELQDILAAAERVEPHIHKTPIHTCRSIDRLAEAQLFFKCENFQKVGAFKFRGACNAVFSLSESEARRGVATHSSGNHAAAIALAARRRGIPAHIVMPVNAPKVKQDAVAGYGGKITWCEPTVESREQTVARVIEQTGATFIHPYNDERVIAGQGTVALELFDQVSELEVVIAPVGGGGLVSGVAIVAASLSRSTRILGAEPREADDACRSLQAGRIMPAVEPHRTLADGLRTSLGPLTFGIIQELVNEIITVSEESIVQAMRTIWERMKIIVEPSAAVVLAAMMRGQLDLQGKRIGLILSGGNVDLEALPWC